MWYAKIDVIKAAILIIITHCTLQGNDSDGTDDKQNSSSDHRDNEKGAEETRQTNDVTDAKYDGNTYADQSAKEGQAYEQNCNHDNDVENSGERWQTDGETHSKYFGNEDEDAGLPRI